MTLELTVTAPSPATLAVATQAFLGLQRGAATGDWSGFVEMLRDDARIMIPVPADVENPPEGLLVGKHIAEMLFASHHDEKVQGARLECKRVSGNDDLVVLECRVEGNLNGELVANFFVFAFEVAGDRIAAMYEYAVWTAKGPGSGWNDVAFAREAFGVAAIPFDESRYTETVTAG